MQEVMTDPVTAKQIKENDDTARFDIEPDNPDLSREKAKEIIMEKI